MRVIVAGALANKVHNGGEAWVRLNWVLGLQALGLDVYFVEQIRSSHLVDEAGAPAAFEQSANRAFFARTAAQFGLAARSCLICDGGGEASGIRYDDLLDLASETDLLVNISGHLSDPALMSRIRRKAYVDIDPGFTQYWHASGLPVLDGHDVYFTIGENIGRPECPIPTCGRQWRVVRQPVVLAHWPVAPVVHDGAFTTVARWRGTFGRVEHGGRTFGAKAHEFRKFARLPALTGQRYQLALDIDPADDADRQMLRAEGWDLVDPGLAAADASRFRTYIQQSAAEFSVAQGIYVETGSGWFSDRTTRYLAAGKPALVQDTGFSRTLPVGEGLVTFRTLGEAADGARRIAADYASHAAAARALAEGCFDSAVVLRGFLEAAGAGCR